MVFFVDPRSYETVEPNFPKKSFFWPNPRSYEAVESEKILFGRYQQNDVTQAVFS